MDVSRLAPCLRSSQEPVRPVSLLTLSNRHRINDLWNELVRARVWRSMLGEVLSLRDTPVVDQGRA
jgi:hypothetical protein